MPMTLSELASCRCCKLTTSPARPPAGRRGSRERPAADPRAARGDCTHRRRRPTRRPLTASVWSLLQRLTEQIQWICKAMRLQTNCPLLQPTSAAAAAGGSKPGGGRRQASSSSSSSSGGGGGGGGGGPKKRRRQVSGVELLNGALLLKPPAETVEVRAQNLGCCTGILRAAC